MRVSYAQAQRIKFTRGVRVDHDDKQINTAVCTLCQQMLWTEGRVDGVTGLGELNRMVARHRHEHTMYDVPPHAPRGEDTVLGDHELELLTDDEADTGSKDRHPSRRI